MAKGKSKKQTSHSRKTGVNTAVQPVVAEEEQSELNPAADVSAAQSLPVADADSNTIAVPPIERYDTAVIAAATESTADAPVEMTASSDTVAPVESAVQRKDTAIIEASSTPAYMPTLQTLLTQRADTAIIPASDDEAATFAHLNSEDDSGPDQSAPTADISVAAQDAAPLSDTQAQNDTPPSTELIAPTMEATPDLNVAANGNKLAAAHDESPAYGESLNGNGQRNGHSANGNGQRNGHSANGNGHRSISDTTALPGISSADDSVSLGAQSSDFSHTDGNGNADTNGYFASLADTVSIYEANAAALPDDEDVSLGAQTSNLSASYRPRRYPLSHTGVKHGARVVNRAARLDPALERRLVAAAQVGPQRFSSTMQRALPARRTAATTRRYPVFMLRQRDSQTRQKPRGGLRVFIVLALLFFITFGSLIGGLIGGYFVEARDLPSVSNISAGGGVNFETTRIYDRNGILLAEIFDQGRRTYVPISQISKYVIEATVAAEDASFYTNPGVDPWALVRAVLINVRGTGSSGASTITQQLARLTLLTDRRYEVSIDRKVKEAILAIQLTQTYSKDQILEMYLNQIYYGNLAYGIEAASESYFGKHANELTLPEAALLAGLPQSPSDYDPTQNFDTAKARQLIVLGLMAKNGYITSQQMQDAAAQPIILHPAKSEIKAPHFVQYVKEYLEAEYGPDVVSRGGLVVTTTLDLRVQAEAERAAVNRVSALKELSATNAAMVAIKPDTGEILAMVGSVDYNNTAIDGQVNVATRERQPGSSLKPIVYAAAFQQGWNPATSVLDVDTVFGYRAAKPYEPHNYDHQDHGWVTVRTALANSFNIPAVKALQFAGIQNVLDLAHAMGIKKGLYRTPDWYGLSLALGGGEVTLLEETNAYATFANGGREVDATPILKMTDSRGNVLQQVDPNPAGTRALDAGVAYQITSILSDNNARAREFGLNSPLHLSFPAAAKTGTTDDNRDSWTMGYTPNLVVGVWVGNDDNSQMKSVTGALGAAYIWHDFMESFYANPSFKSMIAYNLPNQTLASSFTQPKDVVKDTICTLAKGDTTDYFIAGHVPYDCRGYKDPPENRVKGYDFSGRPRPTPTPAGSGTSAGNSGSTGSGSSGGASGSSGSSSGSGSSGNGTGSNGVPAPPDNSQPTNNPPQSNNPPPDNSGSAGQNVSKPANNGEGGGGTP